MLQGEHSAILSTFINLPFAIKTFVLSIFEWPLKTGFTVIFELPHEVLLLLTTEVTMAHIVTVAHFSIFV